MPDPDSDQKPKDGWKEILGLALGIGIVLLAAFAGTSSFDTGEWVGQFGENPSVRV